MNQQQQQQQQQQRDHQMRMDSLLSQSTIIERRYASIMEQNNLGVAHLMKGNMTEAHQHLSAAFEISRQQHPEDITYISTATTTTAASSYSSSSSSSSSSFNSSSTHSVVVPEMMLMMMPPKGPIMSSSNVQSLKWPRLRRDQVIATLRSTLSSDVRTDGIMLSADCFARTPASAQGGAGGGGGLYHMTGEDRSLISAFIIYNIGLVYAIGGMRSANESHLKKAKLMFDSSRLLLLDAFFGHRSSSSSSCPPPPSSVPLGGSTSTSTTSTSTSRNKDALSSLSSSSTVYFNEQLLSPTGNPLLDLLCLMVLSKLSLMNHFLLDYEESWRYTKQLNIFIHTWRIHAPLFSAQGIAGPPVTTSAGGTTTIAAAAGGTTIDVSSAYDTDVRELLEAHCNRFLNEIASLSKYSSLAPAA